MPQLNVGELIEPLHLESIRATPVVIPSPDAAWTHLQLRRFAGCPVCNLHLRKFGTHADDQWSVDELLALARRARKEDA